MASQKLLEIWKRRYDKGDQLGQIALDRLREAGLIDLQANIVEPIGVNSIIEPIKQIEPIKDHVLTFKIPQSLKEQFDLYIKSQNYNIFKDKSKVLRQILYEFLNKQSPDKINSVYQ